jgi:RNA polymerase sigma-70 factor (ECF subfamily)
MVETWRGNGCSMMAMTASLVAVRAPEDLALARRSVGGDRTAQREIVARTKHRAHATIYRVVGSNAQAEDILQETYLAVFRSLATYRGEASLVTWVDRCAVHAAYAWLQRRGPTASAFEVDAEIADGQADAERRVLAREAAAHVYAALDRLEAVQRIAFTLHAIDGRPLEEVADAMEATLAATKTRVWRARQELESRARRDPVLASFLARDAEADR